MKVMLLRLDAPLVSFGAPMIDQNGVVQPFPALSMLAGMLANALGWDRRETSRLEALQRRVRYAARIDRQGQALTDYQTVDLSADWMNPEKAGWTTWGKIARRTGASGEATHQRYRHYRADSLHTVALTLTDESEPTLAVLERAMREPARPLFIGRKSCLPASPILHEIVDATSLVAALAAAPRAKRSDEGPLRATWWDGEEDGDALGPSHAVTVTDERDWQNQVHIGRRMMREGRVNPPSWTEG